MYFITSVYVKSTDIETTIDLDKVFVEISPRLETNHLVT